MKINKIILVISFLVFVTSLKAQVSIIANKSVGETTINSSMAKDIYALDVQQWTDGSSIKVFDFKPDNATKTAFYGYISSKQSDLKKVWLRAKLSGEGNPPKLLGSNDEVLNKVANTTGAVGYISTSAVTDAVKVLAKIN